MYFLISKELIDREDLNIFEKMIMIIISRYLDEKNIKLDIDLLSKKIGLDKETCEIYLNNLKNKKILQLSFINDDIDDLKKVFEEKISEDLIFELLELCDNDKEYLKRVYLNIKKNYNENILEELYNFLKLNSIIKEDLSNNLLKNKDKSILIKKNEEDSLFFNEYDDKNKVISKLEKTVFSKEKKLINNELLIDNEKDFQEIDFKKKELENYKKNSKNILFIDDNFVDKLNKDYFDKKEIENDYQIINKNQNINENKDLENIFDNLKAPLVDKESLKKIYNESVESINKYKNDVKYKNDLQDEKYRDIEANLKKIDIHKKDKSIEDINKINYAMNDLFEDDTETNSKLKLKNMLRQKKLEFEGKNENLEENALEIRNFNNTIATTPFNKASALYKANQNKEEN